MPKPRSKKKTLRDYQWEEQFRGQKRKWNKEYRDKQLAKTTLEQRKIFIEIMRKNHGFGIHEAMEAAGIDDLSAAFTAYMINSRPVKYRILVEEDKVR